MEQKKEIAYLDEVVIGESVTVIQILKILNKETPVFIKPNTHRTYYEGQSIYVPKEFYNNIITDISIYDYAIAMFICSIKEWDNIADKKELREINTYYRDTINKFHIYNE